jgi:purine-binding chemotaxis protein CheW
MSAESPLKTVQHTIEKISEATKRKTVRSPESRHLSFYLGKELFGLPALKVNEIVRMQEITRVPLMPPHILGVTNLRGRVIPVIDLRIKFGSMDPSTDERTCMIVVQTTLPSGQFSQFAMVICSVDEVFDIDDNNYQDTPSFGGSVSTQFIRGMAKIKDKVISLLDIDEMLADEISLEVDNKSMIPTPELS